MKLPSAQSLAHPRRWPTWFGVALLRAASALPLPLLSLIGAALGSLLYLVHFPRRRVVAAVLDPAHVDADRIGLENHLNYFHASGAALPRDLALGLAGFLNSTLLDAYFRQFSALVLSTEVPSGNGTHI